MQNITLKKREKRRELKKDGIHREKGNMMLSVKGGDENSKGSSSSPRYFFIRGSRLICRWN